MKTENERFDLRFSAPNSPPAPPKTRLLPGKPHLDQSRGEVCYLNCRSWSLLSWPFPDSRGSSFHWQDKSCLSATPLGYRAPRFICCRWNWNITVDSQVYKQLRGKEIGCLVKARHLYIFAGLPGPVRIFQGWQLRCFRLKPGDQHFCFLS